MSSRQQILLSLVILTLLSLSLFIIFGDKGLVDLNLLKTERDALIERNSNLSQENLSLYRAIDRLKNDPKYVENVARQELGVIDKDEVIFKLNKTRKAKND